jgi:hypothetical protein
MEDIFAVLLYMNKHFTMAPVLTPYMAEKIMYLQVDQQHIMDAFCL